MAAGLLIQIDVFAGNADNAVSGKQKAAITATTQLPTSTVPLTPQRLRIPSVGVDTAVESVGVNEQGNMKAPENWRHVSWYESGFAPGESGNAVFSGHLDWDDNEAVFWDLNKLQAGDMVHVTEDNRQLSYMVTKRERYDYRVADTSDVFGSSSISQIKLITCDGEFFEGSDTYQKRLIVTAQLVFAQNAFMADQGDSRNVVLPMSK